MSEYVLRAIAVLVTAFMFLVFGIYFGTPVTDTWQHDWIFFGGGVISLLCGIGTLGLFVVLLKQRKEYGDDVTSDIGYPEFAAPPPNRGGAAARAAAAEDTETDSE